MTQNLDTRYFLTGEVRMWSTGSPPTGWLDCDGSAVSRTTYAGLFAVIGTTFGVGDGSTTFNLPDFRGRIPLGVGTGDAVDATAHTLAQKSGAETHTLVMGEMPSHAHNETRREDPGGGQELVADGTGAGVDGASNVVQNIATSSVGGDGSHNNLQPSLGIHFIIKT